MLKRGLRFILLIVMILSIASTGIVCLAEEYETREFLLNGDMEWSGTSYSSWSKHDISTDIVHNGTKAAVLTTTADNADTTNALESRIIITQDISGLIGGQTYTVSYWLRRDVDFEDAEVMNNFQSLVAGAFLKRVPE